MIKKRTLALLLVVPLFLSGCVTTGTYLTGQDKLLYSDAVFLNNTRYIPLVKYCAYYNLDWKWDDAGRVMEIRKNNSVVRLMPGSKTYVYNGNPGSLEDVIEIRGGVIYIPSASAAYLKEAVFALPKPIVAPKPTFTIASIIIDPGHGGKDPGAISAQGTREKDIVLDIAKRIDKKLKSSGLNAILTRSEDKFISLSKRAELANSKKVDLFVSIHANASRASRAKGLEVYYLSEATDDMARALEAAENQSLSAENGDFYENSNDVNRTLWDIQLSENRRESKLLAYYITNSAARRLSLENRGVKSARFYVLKRTRIPAVLVEVGFVTNRAELAKLKDTDYRQKLADAIADGILDYKKEFERTDGFTQ